MFKLANLQKVEARIRRMSPAAVTALKGQLKTEVDGLVEAQKRAAPYDSATADQDQHLRDSIHAYPNPDRVISYRIIADAKDEKGDFIGSHVEAGHRALDGTHVAARPFFFPTYRARKKGTQRRLSKAARDAVRKEFEGA
jgi:hypothetical protein